ncbi:replication initiation and membrane attachment protein [Pullulanibacillus pueri]|uniref:Replication initiation and membrane attachment protein n=1 Tax=Pullulanibacillus pueri TaxID=1437324 RepID=A0A8J2ZZ23_9BACL|nr:DnaD domain protein [Pullulanibacillus pueri]MBM7683465.1 replication initiation and membrane attachment protein [Pullulanibacillus pueri]GGH86790.1 replication initiation and membrane attachment protein [Pullulanibacillus pueri]
MQAHWKELLPVDRYTVRLGAVIQSFDLKIINFLYQPLIGPSACQLYMSLQLEAQGPTTDFTHHHLMVRTNCSLQSLFKDRKLLEAVGLLKVYKSKEGTVTHFIYDLVAPLSPAQFFTDGLLNIFLYNRVGQQEYARLKDWFKLKELPDHYDEVTVSFSDVFTSVNPSELVQHHDPASMEIAVKEFEDKHGEPRLTIDFDFDQLYRKLSDVIISREAFTAEIKEAITKLAFVYKMGPEQMGQIIQRAFLHTGEIDIEQLRKEVRNYYQIENGEQLPALSFRTQPEPLKEFSSTPPKDDYEHLIQWFESISPYELLETVGGGQPAAPDLKIVEEVLFDQKLNPGVVNVLLDYVMRTNDYRLIKGYVTKIAAQWGRKKVKTVREAMELAKSEHKQYQKWTEEKTKRPTQRSNTRRAKLPKWMEEGKQAKSEGQSAPDDKTLAERKQRLEEYLNNL